ncbi:cyclohexanone monooxygenase [Cadophora sp. MPI-SDFR-AT-0126]|nr:cyclohexanone monooxygenase [Leotiomycetes sp. MPI-SDFR-AT-0126]
MGSLGDILQPSGNRTRPLVDQWHSQPRKLRIIHVGAGATGLCTAYKMERHLEDYELVCYEKNDEIGGTWYENRYPGCACDVPAHIYTYTFEPKPDWTSYFAYAPEIQQYFLDFAEKYKLRKYVKLNHKVISARWDDEKGQYEVKVQTEDTIFTDWCHVLLNGSGLLNKWRWPDIPGLKTFKGLLLHSAAWEASVDDYTDKRIAVLGTGSSAIQIIPQVQKVAKHLKCFMRGNTWITPPMPRVPVNADAETAEALVEKVEVDPLVQQYFYKKHEIKKLREDPEFLLQYRKQIEYGINLGFAIFYKGSEASKMAQKYMENEMAKRLQYHPELTKRLIPTWAPGCRRLTPGDRYLETLIKDNVDPVYSDITSIDETGLTTEDGVHHEVDVIACATGFDMAWTPHFELLGVNGVDIKKSWSPVPNCYLGIGAPGFPNYFVMNGPRGNLCNGTVLPCLETEIEFVIKAVKKMQTDRIKTLVPNEEMTNKLNEYVDRWHEGGVWSAECKSWYKNNQLDGKIMCWGGSSIHFLKTIKHPRWEHFNIKYVDDDPWGFLGNGKTHGETLSDFNMMTPYLRNSDVEWDID